MNNTSQILEAAILASAKELSSISKSANAILRAYFATDAAGLIDGLASGSTPATVATKLTKAQLQNMIGCIQQVQKFFSNQDVPQGDYLNSIENVQNGSAVLAQPLSNNVEAIANQVVAVSRKLLNQHAEGVEIVKVYNSSGLGSAVGAISTSTEVFGCSTVASKFLSGIVLVDQFSRMLGNASVTTGDYEATVAHWTQGE